jgi:hypothetical protein
LYYKIEPLFLLHCIVSNQLTMTQQKKYKREPEDFGLPPRAAGGGSDYIAGIPKHLLNDANIDVVLFADYQINDLTHKTIMSETNARPLPSN